MSPETADTIVVGLGAMGSAALYQLAKRGERVLGIERFDVPHAQGSSTGYSRMIRQCYYEHPDYVPLLRRAYELWRELERESGATLLHVTGGVYMGPRGSEVVAGSVRAAREHGLAYEELDHAMLAARYPQFRLPPGWAGMYEPEAGFLLPERVIAAHVELALRRGASIRVHERVVSWESDGTTVEVRTDRGVYRGKRLVIAAGAWAEGVVRDARVRVTPSRQVMGWVWPRRPEMFELGRFPVWALDAGPGEMYYGFPMMPSGSGGPPGLKVARHVRGGPIDPDTPGRETRDGDEADFRPVLQRYIPDADGPLTAMRVCMYENSEDSHFIVDRHAGYGNVVVAAGFSGHGFKFASVMGEALADLAVDGGSRLPVGFLAAARFGGGGGGGGV